MASRARSRDAWGMTPEIPAGCRELLARQDASSGARKHWNSACRRTRCVTGPGQPVRGVSGVRGIGRAAAHPAGEQWRDNVGTGAISPPRKSSRCASGIRICALSGRNARRPGRSPASFATEGRRSAPAAVCRTAPSNAKTAARRGAGCLVLAPEPTALFGGRLRCDCGKLKGAERASVDGRFGALAQLLLRWDRQSSWRCGRSAGV
jgi:hypothetical protein